MPLSCTSVALRITSPTLGPEWNAMNVSGAIRWVFAMVAGIIVGGVCWYYVRDALDDPVLKKLQDSHTLLMQGEVESAGKLINEAEDEHRRALAYAFFAALVSGTAFASLCGFALGWASQKRFKEGQIRSSANREGEESPDTLPHLNTAEKAAAPKTCPFCGAALSSPYALKCKSCKKDLPR
jgi:hypothetical protein